ncbi:MAG TPA: PIN domain-containing protein [Gemmatimonadales bacterium]|nr:PIN domain-containing protein [Gemmatimonadales bacterium]
MKVCPDTNCWIGRGLEEGPAGRRGARVLLVTVVLQELWAGAGTTEGRAYVERLYTLAWRQRRLVNPPTGAWILSGQALEVLARRRAYGPARLRALRNDVLLAATAFVHGAAVMTRDRADFAPIAEVLPVRIVEPGG